MCGSKCTNKHARYISLHNNLHMEEYNIKDKMPYTNLFYQEWDSVKVKCIKSLK